MATTIKGTGTSTFGGSVDVTGSINHDMPMVYAFVSADQSISASTWTKAQLDSTSLDTTSDFDSTTNYRWTPSVAGWYHFSIASRLYATSKTVQALALFKNASGTIQANDNGSQSNYETIGASGLVYANGSTDYFELYAYLAGTTPTIQGNSSGVRTWISAHLVKAD